ncbi:Nn.00g116830.m01.CDS01 [Neocucurbitaria sp. VM-36]
MSLFLDQLEAQLAAHVNAPMHGMESIDQSLMASTPTSFDWHSPSPHLNLDTTIPASFTADDLDLGSFSAGGSMPSIEINECEPFPSLASPSSPVPSSWSGTTRASSPDMPPTSAPPQFANVSQYPASTKHFASPIEPHTAPSWEFMAQASASQLKPDNTSSRGHSRKTSASSQSLDSDDQVMSPIAEVEDDILPLAPAPRLPRQGLFAASHTESPTPVSSRSSFTDRSRALATTPLPSRFEAETLTTEFVQHLESLDYRAYSISPQLFSRFCEVVYPNPQRTTSIEISTSIPMARCHVFLAMAIAMKMRIKDSPENTNALLDTCYELAMQQTTSSTFWQDNGGVEAAQLLSIFASIRKTSSNEPKPLQQSFSW